MWTGAGSISKLSRDIEKRTNICGLVTKTKIDDNIIYKIIDPICGLRSLHEVIQSNTLHQDFTHF